MKNTYFMFQSYSSVDECMKICVCKYVIYFQLYSFLVKKNIYLLSLLFFFFFSDLFFYFFFTFTFFAHFFLIYQRKGWSQLLELLPVAPIIFLISYLPLLLSRSLSLSNNKKKKLFELNHF